MNRLTISSLAFIALLAAGAGFLGSRSQSIKGQVGTTGMATTHSQELQGAAQTDKLPVEEFEDRSLVFPREAKR
jgi:hypothetical protein